MRFIKVALAFMGLTLAAEMENGILVLNGQNFHEEIMNYEYLIVEFYATWW